jgi:hypothetical protein
MEVRNSSVMTAACEHGCQTAVWRVEKETVQYRAIRADGINDLAHAASYANGTMRIEAEAMHQEVNVMSHELNTHSVMHLHTN